MIGANDEEGWPATSGESGEQYGQVSIDVAQRGTVTHQIIRTRSVAIHAIGRMYCRDVREQEERLLGWHRSRAFSREFELSFRAYA